ncbi:MAG TPA: ABC transporter ATP-binding protein, partial [Spirillospora sp.]|nr:ABC transporter ATP-binding protein [Spirillospora sp.]
HDLSVVEHISDRVAVMYVGKMVEVADTRDLFTRPKHPYTEALLSAIPRPDPDRPMQEVTLEGEVPNPANPPSGCYFHPRCKYAQEICKREKPPLVPAGNNHFAACHFADQLDLKGVEV